MMLAGMARPGIADSVPVEGDILLYFTSLYDQEGNWIGHRYDGSQVSLKLNANIPITIPIGIKDAFVGQGTLFWSEPRIWNNAILPLTNYGNIVKAIVNDGVGHPSIQQNWKAWDALLNGGPTEKTFSQTIVEIDVPGFNLSFGAGLSEKFDVYLVDGVDILMDQTVVLERLTVYSGARVTGNNTFRTRTDLVNRGLFDNLMGTIEGDFVNDGQTGAQGRAVIMGPLNVLGNLLNTGEIEVASGVLTLNRPTANDGLLTLFGGQLQLGGDFSNFGTLDLKIGDVSGSGTVMNFGLLRKSGPVGSSVTIPSALVSTGMLEVSSGTLTLHGGGDITGIMSLCPNGQLVVGNNSVLSLQGGVTVTNAGTVRKTGGGVSTISSIEFNNSGLVEVLDGTLALTGGGTSSGRFHIDSAGVLEFGSAGHHELNNGASFTGDGVVRVATGPSNARVLVNGQVSMEGQLDVVTGGVLVNNLLEVAGGVEFRGGTIGGEGDLRSGGEFGWTGGEMRGYDGTGCVTILPGGSMEVIGGLDQFKVMLGRRIDNQGTVTWRPGSGVVNWGYGANINNLAGGAIDFQGDTGFGWTKYWDYHGRDTGVGPTPQVNNAGTVRKTGGGVSTISSIEFNNSGLVEVLDGTLAFQGGLIQTAGVTRLCGGSISGSSLIIDGGSLTGSGAISANLRTSGVVSPGDSPGTMTIDGEYWQAPTGTLLIELAGRDPGQFDVLAVSGQALLDGTLVLTFLDEFRPLLGDTFEVLTYGSRSGEFASIEVLGFSGYEFAPLYGDTSMLLATEAVPEPATLGLLGIGLGVLLGRHRQRETARLT
jgi:hypothetical protein